MAEQTNWRIESYPGYFGKRRDEIEKGYDEKYGKGNWKLAWYVDGQFYDFDEAIQLYEDAYLLFFMHHPEHLVKVMNYENVYDNDPSNVNCKGYNARS